MGDGADLISGLSPLARGNHRSRRGRNAQHGPIPARTGQPNTPFSFLTAKTAYPRSHGATHLLLRFLTGGAGLSPLARGNQTAEAIFRDKVGPIPARTGQPWSPLPRARTARAYPRSHGATPGFSHSVLNTKGLSPLARGNLWMHCLRRCCLRPIPARTGQPCAEQTCTVR